jgi:hypothetical protein
MMCSFLCLSNAYEGTSPGVPFRFQWFFCPQILHSVLVKTPKRIWVPIEIWLSYQIFDTSIFKKRLRTPDFWRIRTWNFAHMETSTRVVASRKTSELLKKLSPRYEVFKKCMLYNLHYPWKEFVSWKFHISKRVCSKVRDFFWKLV